MGLKDDLAAADARHQKKGRSVGVQAIREQVDNFEAAMAQAQIEIDAANAECLHEREMRRQAEAQVIAERNARTAAEAQAAADQRARIDAESAAAREKARADGLQATVAELRARPAPAPVLAAPQPAKPAPVAYRHEVSRGTDGLIRSIESRPI